MNSEPHFGRSLRAELSDWQIWQTRVVVLAFAALSGLTVVAFTWLTEHALAGFFRAHAALPWLPLIWTCCRQRNRQRRHKSPGPRLVTCSITS